MQLKKIASFDNYLLANMTKGLLEDHEIICSIGDQNIVLSDPLLSNAVGGIKIFVAENQFEEAQAIILEAENKYLEEKICTKCYQQGLVVHEFFHKPKGIFQKLKNTILYGQENLYAKKYRCLSCNYLNEIIT